MPSKQLPASIRSLRAQLRVLQRPSVWASAAVLLGTIVLLQETWKHPERFATPDQPSVSGFSASDLGDAEAPTRPAPLDPLSSVEEPQFGSAQGTRELPSSSSGLTDANGADRLPSPLLLPNRPSARSSSSPSIPDPFASIRTNSSAAGSNSGSSTGIGTPRSFSSGSDNGSQSSFVPENSSGDQSDNALGSTSLDSATDRSSTQSQPTLSTLPGLSSPDPNTTGINESTTSQTPPTSSVPTSSIGQPTFTQPQPIPGQPSYGQTQPQPQFLPQTSPAPGTTGYTMPPAFRTNDNTSAGRSFGNYSNSYGNNSSNSSSGVPSTVSPSTTQPGTANPTVQPQAQPQAAPFSIPRAVPGQSIGGGEINTFSNP